MVYNWQFPDWPNFIYDVQEIQSLSIEFAQENGHVSGMVTGLPKEFQQESLLQLMLAEAVKTSEIEGEFVSREDVMSSIRNNLGLNEILVNVKDQRANGLAQLMIEVRKSFDQPLRIEMLLDWHRMLMQNSKYISPGKWRKGDQPMQVISGTYGKEIIHFEAPPSSRVSQEMSGFVKWYNETSFPLKDGVSRAILKSAIAHLYFESIHPFEDGNGRIGRAVAEKAISQSLGRPVLLSLSKVIESDKNAYYTALKEAQRTLEITPWLRYFASVIVEAQRDAKIMIEFTLKKAKFFDSYKLQLNERQLKAIHKMMEKGLENFEGGMTAQKYMSINKTSKATATRDLQQLYTLGALLQTGAGRSVSYQLNIA